MKTLFLLRHAEAEPSQSDFARRLTPAGLVAARHVGEILRARYGEPAAIYCSEARRTRETLKELGLSARPVFKPEIYGAAPGQLLSLLQSVDEAVPSLLLVGHNPAMHNLAHGLTGSAADKAQWDRMSQHYAPATLAVLTFDHAWFEAGPGAGRLIDLITP